MVGHLSTWFSTVGTCFLVIFLAELGDKTQLVCMTLAARFRGLPVFFGAMTAFGILNVLAVVFGAALTQWIPEKFLVVGVAVLFAVFGIQALRASGAGGDAGDQPDAARGGHGIFVTAFLMIFLAELGDKTQIAAAGLAVTAPPVPVWIGATLGEALSAALAIVAGQKLLHRIPIKTVHKVSGVFFLLLAGLALTRLL
ncbi:MAG TPA: TMEM165/GDT1 family protein [Magnetococcales bacterium]|nr:TMEM165/GDT1 family protein [Magnetococcales bacterium]